MDESQFHRLADETLERLAERIEDADEAGEIDVDLQEGVLTLELEDGRQYVINKHAAMQEVWVSSPVSGAHHFARKEERWLLKDGTGLERMLEEELRQLGLSAEFG